MSPEQFPYTFRSVPHPKAIEKGFDAVLIEQPAPEDSFDADDGPLDGLVFMVDHVGFRQDGEAVRMSYHYTVLENPQNVPQNSALLNKTVGDIVVELLSSAIGDGEDFLAEKT